MTESAGISVVHALRALTVDLNMFAAEFARKHSFNVTDVRALICLLDAQRSNTPATPGWLGAQLAINSASVTALIDRMTRAGHVRRERDVVDRRRILLHLTPAAVTLGENFFGPLIARVVDTADTFTSGEQQTIRRFVTAIRDDVAAVRESSSDE
ncbi:DNA-binding MarR family transcriptional regulator [Rhodococcus sp. 27YEA15]|uniref:MarR family transcriptional regulator n=1 Tax=Rhodococcus sp. 27YEA15 TaxID=3156259 RepID=UPI003C7C7DCF